MLGNARGKIALCDTSYYNNQNMLTLDIWQTYGLISLGYSGPLANLIKEFVSG